MPNPFVKAVLTRRGIRLDENANLAEAMRADLLDIKATAQNAIDQNLGAFVGTGGKLVDSAAARQAAARTVNEVNDSLRRGLTGAAKRLSDSRLSAFRKTALDVKFAVESSTGDVVTIGGSFGQIFEEAADRASRAPVLGIPAANQLSRTGKFAGVRYRQAISKSVLTGQSIPDLSQELEKIGDMTGHSAARVARNNMNAVQNDAHRSVYEANPDIFIGYRWDATMDDRTSAICAALNGRFYPLGSRPPGPPAHHNCRSVLVGVFRDEELELDTARGPRRVRTYDKNGDQTGSQLVPANQSFDEWMRLQPEPVTRRITGSKTREKLWRSNRLGLDDLISEDLVPLNDQQALRRAWALNPDDKEIAQLAKKHGLSKPVKVQTIVAEDAAKVSKVKTTLGTKKPLTQEAVQIGEESLELEKNNKKLKSLQSTKSQQKKKATQLQEEIDSFKTIGDADELIAVQEQVVKLKKQKALATKKVIAATDEIEILKAKTKSIPKSATPPAQVSKAPPPAPKPVPKVEVNALVKAENDLKKAKLKITRQQKRAEVLEEKILEMQQEALDLAVSGDLKDADKLQKKIRRFKKNRRKALKTVEETEMLVADLEFKVSDLSDNFKPKPPASKPAVSKEQKPPIKVDASSAEDILDDATKDLAAKVDNLAPTKQAVSKAQQVAEDQQANLKKAFDSGDLGLAKQELDKAAEVNALLDDAKKAFEDAKKAVIDASAAKDAAAKAAKESAKELGAKLPNFKTQNIVLEKKSDQLLGFIDSTDDKLVELETLLDDFVSSGAKQSAIDDVQEQISDLNKARAQFIKDRKAIKSELAKLADDEAEFAADLVKADNALVENQKQIDFQQSFKDQNLKILDDLAGDSPNIPFESTLEEQVTKHQGFVANMDKQIAKLSKEREVLLVKKKKLQGQIAVEEITEVDPDKLFEKIFDIDGELSKASTKLDDLEVSLKEFQIEQADNFDPNSLKGFDLSKKIDNATIEVENLKASKKAFEAQLKKVDDAASELAQPSTVASLQPSELEQFAALSKSAQRKKLASVNSSMSRQRKKIKKLQDKIDASVSVDQDNLLTALAKENEELNKLAATRDELKGLIQKGKSGELDKVKRRKIDTAKPRDSITVTVQQERRVILEAAKTRDEFKKFTPSQQKIDEIFDKLEARVQSKSALKKVRAARESVKKASAPTKADKFSMEGGNDAYDRMIRGFSVDDDGRRYNEWINSVTKLDEKALSDFTYQWDFIIRELQNTGKISDATMRTQISKMPQRLFANIDDFAEKKRLVTQLVEGHIDRLERLTRESPSVAGDIFRGIGELDDAVFDDLTSIGSEFNMRGIHSATTDRNVAINFARTKPKGRIVFKMQNTRGSALGRFSRFKSENEILASGTNKYRITAIKSIEGKAGDARRFAEVTIEPIEGTGIVDAKRAAKLASSPVDEIRLGRELIPQDTVVAKTKTQFAKANEELLEALKDTKKSVKVLELENNIKSKINVINDDIAKTIENIEFELFDEEELARLNAKLKNLKEDLIVENKDLIKAQKANAKAQENFQKAIDAEKKAEKKVTKAGQELTEQTEKLDKLLDVIEQEKQLAVADKNKDLITQLLDKVSDDEAIFKEASESLLLQENKAAKQFEEFNQLIADNPPGQAVAAKENAAKQLGEINQKITALTEENEQLEKVLAETKKKLKEAKGL